MTTNPTMCRTANIFAGVAVDTVRALRPRPREMGPSRGVDVLGSPWALCVRASPCLGGVGADGEHLGATSTSYHRVRVRPNGSHPMYMYPVYPGLQFRMQRMSRPARRMLRKSRTLNRLRAVTECLESFDTFSPVRLPNAARACTLHALGSSYPTRTTRALLFVFKLMLSYTHLVHRESL